MTDAISKWLEQHDRLSFKEIFRSLDRGNIGDLKKTDLIKGFQRIGIELKSNEISLLQERLDLKKLGNFETEPLMQIMAGIPTRQFLPNSIIKLSKLVMAKDWDEK